MKEWEAVRTPRKGKKGWEDGAPRRRTEGRGQNVELLGFYPRGVCGSEFCPSR